MPPYLSISTLFIVYHTLFTSKEEICVFSSSLHQYQGANKESEAQFLEHGVDEHVCPLAVCQGSVHQQCAEEEQLMVHDAHATYHTGALQSEAVPVWQ